MVRGSPYATGLHYAFIEGKWGFLVLGKMDLTMETSLITSCMLILIS